MPISVIQRTRGTRCPHSHSIVTGYVSALFCKHKASSTEVLRSNKQFFCQAPLAAANAFGDRCLRSFPDSRGSEHDEKKQDQSSQGFEKAAAVGLEHK